MQLHHVSSHKTSDEQHAQAANHLCWTLYYLDRSYAVAFLVPYLLLDEHITAPPPPLASKNGQTFIKESDKGLEILLYGKDYARIFRHSVDTQIHSEVLVRPTNQSVLECGHSKWSCLSCRHTEAVGRTFEELCSAILTFA